MRERNRVTRGAILRASPTRSRDRWRSKSSNDSESASLIQCARHLRATSVRVHFPLVAGMPACRGERVSPATHPEIPRRSRGSFRLSANGRKSWLPLMNFAAIDRADVSSRRGRRKQKRRSRPSRPRSSLQRQRIREASRVDGFAFATSASIPYLSRATRSVVRVFPARSAAAAIASRVELGRLVLLPALFVNLREMVADFAMLSRAATPRGRSARRDRDRLS